MKMETHVSVERPENGIAEVPKGPARDGADVSVIIVNWNTRDLLCDCLRSVYEQTRGITFEVIVVDNASRDDSATMVRTEFPQAVVIENKENTGFAAANNQAMAIAQGRYVLLLNPDTVVRDYAIQKSIAFADQDSSCAVVGIRNESPDGSLQRNCFRFGSVANLLICALGLHEVFPGSRLWGRERLSWWDYRGIREVDCVAGCYMLVRHDAIRQVGRMDEAYFMYGEEMDWCWRFRRGGWKVLYYPDATIVHYGGAASSQNAAAMRIAQRQSLLRFIQKREGRPAGVLARAILFASGAVRFVYWVFRWILGSHQIRLRSQQKARQAITMAFGR